MKIRVAIFIAVVSAAASASAYRCTGKLCDVSTLGPSDCGTYIEIADPDPLVPSTAKKKMVLIHGNKDESCGSQRTLACNVSQSKTDSESGSVSGKLAQTLVQELSGGIKDVVGYKGSVSISNESSDSATFTGTFTFTVADSITINIPANSKGYINAFVSRKYGSFTKVNRLVATWGKRQWLL